MIQSNLYDSIRVRNMYTYSIYIFTHTHIYNYIYNIYYYIYLYMIHVGGIDSKLQLFNWDLVWTSPASRHHQRIRWPLRSQPFDRTCPSIARLGAHGREISSGSMWQPPVTSHVYIFNRCFLRVLMSLVQWANESSESNESIRFNKSLAVCYSLAGFLRASDFKFASCKDSGSHFAIYFELWTCWCTFTSKSC